MRKVANDTVLGETIAETLILARSGRFWLGLLGTGFVVGLTGPFGTYDALAIPLRTAYWVFAVTTTFWLGYLVCFAVTTVAERYGTHAIVSVGIGSFVAGIPVAVWLAGFHTVVFETPFWADVKGLLPYVIVICFAVAVLFEAAQTGGIAPVPAAAPRPDPAWLDQLPHHLGRELLLLHAQDHYIRAETPLGETLIRATLQEATDDLGAYGIRLHRSWWVARDAVKALRYRNGTPCVVLKDGRELPVGRKYRRSVKDALR
ncbi:LytTR family DNA-binding domain-containing protein [Yoonia sp. GPGPB17]|uniref:LytTR family DNA-binding domain-containing protein n=1 Tax=Yoonia sp. GPGPB17 TaxID=3026147 RepID=UPI0030C291C4